MQSAKAQLREFLLAQSGRGAASSDVTDAALRALDAVFSRDAADRQRQLEEGERQLRERLAAVEAKEVPLRTPSFLGREALCTRVASLAVPLTSPGCATRARCWTLQAAVRSQSAAIALERQRFDALTDSVRDLQLLRQRLGQQLVIGTAAAGNAALSEAIFRHLAGQEAAVSVRVGVYLTDSFPAPLYTFGHNVCLCGAAAASGRGESWRDPVWVHVCLHGSV